MGDEIPAKKKRRSWIENVMRVRSEENAQRCSIVSSSLTDSGLLGLPLEIQKIFENNRKIDKLYDWQEKCLKMKSVENGRNLIISLPTGGGKTLVAEIFILKQVVCRQKDALFILPFVSIVQEKIKAFLPFGLECDFLVEEYAANKGRIPPIKHRKKKAVYIATIEKAHSLVNSLIESKTLNSLGLIVIDELHMIGEGYSRGSCLEQIISKVQYVSPSTQLIGISATLNNVDQLKEYMKAELLTDDFRPVTLTEYVKFGNKLYKIDYSKSGDQFLQFSRELLPSSSTHDPDSVSGLVLEVIPDESCLVFCPSKKNCENVAILLSQVLPSALKEHKTVEKKNLLKALWSECDSNICPIQRSCIPFGVAYHHSGLTADERKLIQEAFLEGTLSVLCCTSTLAAGVNLPAKRVILRSPMIGIGFLTKQQYKQMSGRAGRAGLDVVGESVLIVQSSQKPSVIEMLGSPYDKCQSSLLYQDGCGLKALILNIVGLNIISTKSGLIDFLKQTFLWLQSSQNDMDNLLKNIECSLRYLVDNNFIELSKLNDENDFHNSIDLNVKATNMGKATLSGSINLDFANEILTNLKSALQCMVLSTRLHLLYCVISYEHVADMTPDWNVFYQEFSATTKEERRLFDILNVTEDFLFMKTIGSTKAKNSPSEQILNRLYLALALRRLWQHETVWKVAQRFQLTRGYVQNLLQSCSAFASSLSRFCENIEDLWALQCLLPSFSKQLAYCVNAELIPLMEIQGVKQGRARQLFNAGFKSVKDIASADVDTLIHQIEHFSRRQARDIISGAKMLLHEEYEHIMQQAEEIFSANADANVSVDDIIASLRPVE